MCLLIKHTVAQSLNSLKRIHKSRKTIPSRGQIVDSFYTRYLQKTRVDEDDGGREEVLYQ